MEALKKKDEKYMARCLQLAQNGLPKAFPNPLVGAVVVYKDQIIGEGYHQEYGKAHAEVNAIAAVKDTSLLPHSTIYVNLEPCAHFGKTPPCADLIIKHKLKRVVVGVVDSFSKVCGQGIQRMREAGIEVTVGVLEHECRTINKRFFTFHEKQRPFVTLKWAQTADRFIDLPRKNTGQRPLKITNNHSSRLVHKLRSEHDAILIGTKTALMDNPKLTTRLWPGKDPIRIVIDRSLKVPQESTVFNETCYVVTEKNDEINYAKKIQLKFDNKLIERLLKKLHELKIQTLLVEGGSLTLTDFIRNSMWDEAYVFTNNVEIHEGIKAPELSKKAIFTQHISNDVLNVYTNYET
ncbi:MAG: riboflavin biosynthesis protein RibD [Crocinitomicaceae bacterium]|nr:riboflavin biosynthesis protein RibD [Crocinitomicaceae bacterium]|tara:strand:+ start:2614 stop:3663 length:1050 start_codon:yes stop_codon:yes gene_type:complete